MFDYVHSDLGNRSKGDILEVTLTRSANVRLLDSTNFNRYRRGQKHRYQGGLATKSPVRIQIPSSGRWHGVVDMQGLGGSAKASFRVLNGSAMRPLPPIREKRSDLAELLENAEALLGIDDDPEFDVFVSHASEDKDAIVRPLAEALRTRGVSVWYDEFELRIGDSLRQKIDIGIARSRFGLVVVSKAFFAKGWPRYELDGLVTMAVNHRQVLLPIWHEISRDEVVSQSPSLADKLALRTADYGIDEIADEIAAVIAGV